MEIAVFLEVFDQVGVPRQPGNTKDHATAGLSLRMFLSDLDWEVPGEKRVMKELGAPPRCRWFMVERGAKMQFHFALIKA